MRILYADDQDELRLLAQMYLEKAGHRVVAVASGQEALRAFACQSFDAVLLDEHMPGLSGTEVLHAIRAAAKASVPVAVALTGFNTDTDVQRLEEAGFDAVVGKPFHFEVLESMLRSLLSQKSCGAAMAVPSLDSTHPSPSILDRFAGDEELLRKVVHTFLQELPARLAGLQQAIREKQVDTLVFQAHALKGSLSMLGLEHAAKFSQQLQQAAQAQDLSAACLAFAALQEAIAELPPNLRGYVAQKRTSAPGASTPSQLKLRVPGFKRK